MGWEILHHQCMSAQPDLIIMITMLDGQTFHLLGFAMLYHVNKNTNISTLLYRSLSIVFTIAKSITHRPKNIYIISPHYLFIHLYASFIFNNYSSKLAMMINISTSSHRHTTPITQPNHDLHLRVRATHFYF